ncbi:uncharacterized protein LOC113383633 [Ctenocephalides felis]|uniref:uncharacterized protein LOC113383633 n=1 Tax=Ctenocephalides felis TaxID=7515 RepID=UPI000E6E4EEE|nr:uncharacterized protein LOC113383633 [Ctenocephalides felis]
MLSVNEQDDKKSTRPPLRCEMTALVLHYAHLVVAAWIFVYCHAISDHVTGNDSAFNMRYNCLMAYGAPAVFVLFAYAVTPDSYESKNYCWMSAQKGMFLNYMLPVTSLIIVNTVFATFALKSVNQKIQNALTVSIESILDPANVPKIITSELNLDEELLFEASEWRSDFKNKNLMKSNLNKPLDILDSDQYQKTLDSLEKTKTTDQKNLNIYVDIENAKYSADNPNIFYEIGTSKDYEYQTVVEHPKDTEKVPYYDCCDHHHRSNNDRLGDLASVSLGDFSLQSSDFPELSDFRKCLRFAIFLQPAYDVCWFLGVVAVENATSSNVMPVVFIVCFNILSWVIFARSASLCPLINRNSSTESGNSETSSTHNYHNCYDTINSRGGSSSKQRSCSMSDDIPLLLNASSPYSSAYRAGNADNELATTELASCSRSMTGADVICTITN